jgi:hypothetical protein
MAVEPVGMITCSPIVTSSNGFEGNVIITLIAREEMVILGARHAPATINQIGRA